MHPADVLNSLPTAVYFARARQEGDELLIEEVTFLNDRIEKITGWSKEEIRRNPLWLTESIHPEDRDMLRVKCGNGKEVSRIYRLRKKDGSYIYVLDILSVLNGCDSERVEMVGVIEDISKEVEYRDVFSAIDQTPEVGVLIYQDTIVYSNRVATELLGYSKEELYRMPVYEVVAPDYKEPVKEVVSRRLRGEKFDKVYTEFPVVAKDGTVRFLFVFTKTIQWNGRPAGFVIFFDITKKVRYERLFRVLKEVNRVMVSCFNKEELLREVCRILYEKAGFRMVWVGVPDPESGYIKPVEVCGYDEGYVESIKIFIDENVPEGRGPTGTALREGKIVINPDTRTNPAVEPWREEMLKRGYLSSCAIPLRIEGKTVALLNIYSGIPNMFGKEELELLEEIQRDLSFAMERIEKEKFSKMISVAIEKGHEWVFITDEEGNILYANSAVEYISGYRAQELIGKNPRIFKSGYHKRSFYEKLWKTIKDGKVFHALFVNRKKDGGLFYLDQMIVPVEVEKGEFRFVALGKDVSTEMYLEKELTKLRFMDVLTELPNREGFLSAVEIELEKSKDESHVLFVLDVRGLAGINQVYGTGVGDIVLKKIASSLKKILFRRDIVGRVGGDKFAIFTKGIPKEEAGAVVEKIVSAVSEPVPINGSVVPVSVNIGAAVYPDDAQTAQELMEKAYVALSFAKREGENSYRFFSEDINRLVHERISVKAKLKSALEEGRFTLYLQPFYRAGTEQIAGFEVLLRMFDEEGNILSPKDFIPALESTGLIRDVDKWVLHTLRERVRNLEGLSFSVNVSPKSFRDKGYMEEVRKVAEDMGNKLILEITERVLVEDIDYTKGLLQGIRSAGVRVAVDDFGTGYSSLAYLENLPVDILKIDMSFTKRMVKSRKALAIVQSVADLARRLGLETIGEGVETKDQLALLRELGCTYVQGFYLSKPLPWDEALRLI